MSGRLLYRYVHVSIGFNSEVKTKELEPFVAGVSGDWLRYNSTNWILWTAHTTTQCADHIRRGLSPLDHILAIGLDIHDKGGWLPSWIWDWLNKDRPIPNPLAAPAYWTPSNLLR